MSDEQNVQTPGPKAITQNANDPKQAREGKKTERQRELRKLADVKQLMSEPWGRRIAYRLIEACEVFKNGFSPDLAWASFYAGQRNIGLMLLKDVQTVASEEYGLMMKESKES